MPDCLAALIAIGDLRFERGEVELRDTRVTARSVETEPARAASLHNHGSTTFFGSTSAHLSPGNVGSLRGTEGEEEGEGEVPWDEEPPGRASPSAVSPTVAGADA